MLAPLRDAPVLVPLCGMSEDMAHLAGAGAQVWGVDVAEQPLRTFLHHRGLQPEEVRHEGCVVLNADPFRLVVGDMLDQRLPLPGGFRAIWDRAALIALPPPLQQAYAERLLDVLQPGGRVLLVSLEYDAAETSGPPFPVPRQRILELFHRAESVQPLHRQPLSHHGADEPLPELESAWEAVYLITRTHGNGSRR